MQNLVLLSDLKKKKRREAGDEASSETGFLTKERKNEKGQPVCIDVLSIFVITG